MGAVLAPGFIAFLARRLIAGVFLLAAVAAVSFLLVSLAPGDVADTLAGQSGADPSYLRLIRERFGLEDPLPYRVASYLGALVQGDFGFSPVQGRPVLDVILERVGASLLLAVTALVLAAVAGIGLGVLAAVRRGGKLDTLVSLGSVLAYSVPVFWLGQLLVGLLSVRLGWLPAGGMRSPTGSSGVLDVGEHLLLPAVTLSTLLVALLVRMTRAAMIDVLQEEYVRAARARGLSEKRVLFRHALPNAMRPVVTVLTGYFGTVLTGAVLVETVFVWPGLGRLLYDSVLARDTPVLTGLLVFSALVIFTANLLADVLYRVLDKRTGFE